jgi:Uma2 family endonuclease
MATTLVGVEEYLHMQYEHDPEYVEGRIVPRPMPRKAHSKMQSYLDRTLYAIAHPLGFEVWVEQHIRTQAEPARYRIPAVCLTVGEPDEQIFTGPPFLCIEILSPDESAAELRLKLDEYLAFGVSFVWVIDPVLLSGEIYTADRIERVRNGMFRAGDIAVQLSPDTI